MAVTPLGIAWANAVSSLQSLANSTAWPLLGGWKIAEEDMHLPPGVEKKVQISDQKLYDNAFWPKTARQLVQSLLPG
jgi:hypothetical protein